MIKLRVLAFSNILFSVFFGFILLKTTSGSVPFLSIQSFIHAYGPNAILLLSLVVNVMIAYRILIQKESRKKFFFYLLLTISTIVWFLLLFFGYFFVSSVVFPIISITLGLICFYALKRSSKKMAVILAVTTVIVSGIVIVSGFEEDYCWKKGDAADPTGTKMVKATASDAKRLQGFKVTEGSDIGVSFRAHMLCHDSFNFVKALEEKYIFLK